MHLWCSRWRNASIWAPDEAGRQGARGSGSERVAVWRGVQGGGFMVSQTRLQSRAAEQSGRARTRGPGGSKQVGAVVGRGIVWCVVEGHGIEGTRVDTVKPPPKNLDME